MGGIQLLFCGLLFPRCAENNTEYIGKVPIKLFSTSVS